MCCKEEKQHSVLALDKQPYININIYINIYIVYYIWCHLLSRLLLTDL